MNVTEFSHLVSSATSGCGGILPLSCKLLLSGAASPDFLDFGEWIIMGLCTLFMTPKRIGNSAIAIAASTLLDFHRALVSRKYSRLFSKKAGQSLVQSGLHENCFAGGERARQTH
jgi:hypothetical protein